MSAPKLPDELQKELDAALFATGLAGWRAVLWRLEEQVKLVGRVLHQMEQRSDVSHAALFEAKAHHEQVAKVYASLNKTWSPQFAAIDSK